MISVFVFGDQKPEVVGKTEVCFLSEIKFPRPISSKMGLSFDFYSVFFNFLAFKVSAFFKFFIRVFAKTYSCLTNFQIFCKLKNTI